MTANGVSDEPLKDRIALVSGAAHGIGKAIARRFQQAGARVIVLDCDVQAGGRAAAELTEATPSRPGEFFSADLLHADQIKKAVVQIADRFGRVDVLVNNAGVEIEKPFETTTVEDWDCILGINLRGAFLLTQSVLPLFPERGGAIVNVSSIHATMLSRIPSPMHAPRLV